MMTGFSQCSASGSQHFDVGGRSVLGVSDRAGAEGEAERDCRYSGCNHVSIRTTVHDGASVGRFFIEGFSAAGNRTRRATQIVAPRAIPLCKTWG
jgi:hypothetical protein